LRSALNARPTASQGVAPAAAPNANPPAPGVPEVVPFCSAHVVPFYSALDTRVQISNLSAPRALKTLHMAQG